MKQQKFLRFDLQAAYQDPTCEEMPPDYMETHYNVVWGVPQPVYDCWWFCVEVESEDELKNLPSFLTPMKPFNLSYWRDKCFKDCEWFEENHSCCYGGDRCLKDKPQW